MYSAAAITPFVRRVKEELVRRNITIWVYSGFTYETILRDNDMRALLSVCDVLVDGPFLPQKKGLNLPHKGSSNQRIIDIQKSLSSGAVITLYGD